MDAAEYLSRIQRLHPILRNRTIIIKPYWHTNTRKKCLKHFQHVDGCTSRRNGLRGEGGDNLTRSPGSTYHFRSFVRTATGTTYGKEQTFTTEVATGIDTIESDTTAPTVIGYYDLNGRKRNEPTKGLNIIRHSDGSARKVLVK